MKERLVQPKPGALVFVLFVALLGLGAWSIIQAESGYLTEILVWVAIGSFTLALLLLSGFYTLQPNESRVLILFGNYRGTVKTPGWHWGNPFFSNGSPSSELKEER